MTSRPPPRTNSTRSRPSVSTSRNSMSVGHRVKEAAPREAPRGTQGSLARQSELGALAHPGYPGRGAPGLTSHTVHLPTAHLFTKGYSSHRPRCSWVGRACSVGPGGRHGSV